MGAMRICQRTYARRDARDAAACRSSYSQSLKRSARAPCAAEATAKRLAGLLTG